MRAVSIDKMKMSASYDDKNNQIDRWSKRFVLRWLENVSVGYLTVNDGEEVHYFGDANDSLAATITVTSSIAYRDILFNGLVGAGEAYMRGAWQSTDVVTVVRVLSANFNEIQSKNSVWSAVNQGITSLLHRFFRANTQENSRLNIAAHYDLGNDFFGLFLDKSMMYSSAIYPTADATLETAATYKLEHICQRLQLNENDHLLEIGTGWGGMAIYAATHYGCHVTTTTISKEQYEHAKKAVQDAKLDDKITVLLDDYRDLKGQFDKLVSIEMIEAVGHKYYQQYFSACSRLLKPNGLMLIQAITVPDQRYDLTKKGTDFIQRYIFPGGELPSVTVMSKHVEKDTDMQIVGIDDITLDYAKTLAAWRERFFEKIDHVREQGFDDVFIRMWDFYFAYCEGGFRERAISTVQLVMAKPRCQQLPYVVRS
ncbi:MAG: cyclopropane-fatty-acyl-phospholipid synthase [Candidatus Endobugula sp.]